MKMVICGRCDSTLFLGGIYAPEGGNVERLRTNIERDGQGPAKCPKCGQLVMMRIRPETPAPTEAEA